MARKTEWYEEQAAQAPWRGTVNGRDAYIDRWKGKWEICCRVTAHGKGLVMFPLNNRAAIRNLADAVKPALPEALLKRALKSATRDVPIRRPRHVVRWLLVLALLTAAAWIYLRRPDLIEAVRGHLPFVPG
ncbi:MAG: hypothetical protein ACYS0E_17475 [Planctomycetota bacterium]|jgi:hypothetical protein